MEKLIIWDDFYSVGCEEIDNQHKKLANLINDLYDAYQNNRASEIFENILSELKEYTIYHFSTEEKYFEKYNYPFTEEHKIEHQNFVKKVLEFSNRYSHKDKLVIYDVMLFLKDWLLNHILGSDKKYSEYICK